MSTAVAKARVDLPVNINEQLAMEAASLQKRLSAPSGNRITVTQSKTFRLPDGTESPGPIQAVVVDFISANYYYESSFDRNNIVPPSCFSLGLEPSGMVPSENSPEKQAESCAACWANQFGSAGKGKACQNTKLLALLPPDADDGTELWLLKVSPTAVRAWDSYVATVSRMFQLPPVGVMTEIGFDPNSDFASLRFGNPQPLQHVNPELLAIAFGRRQEAMDRLMVEPDVSGAAQPQPVAAPKSRGAKPVARGR